MTTDERQQAIGGISRRGVLRGGLIVGAGMATVGAASAIFTGTAQASSLQSDWAFCIYCSALWWHNTNSADTHCPGSPTGYHQTGSGDYNYDVYNGISGLNGSSNPQPNWRFCNLCGCLFWGGYGGSCWGNGRGPHNAGSTIYDMYWGGPDSAITNPQYYWRWCGLCSEMFWPGKSGNVGGVCPYDGSNHSAGSGTTYWMYYSGTY